MQRDQDSSEGQWQQNGLASEKIQKKRLKYIQKYKKKQLSWLFKKYQEKTRKTKKNQLYSTSQSYFTNSVCNANGQLIKLSVIMELIIIKKALKQQCNLGQYATYQKTWSCEQSNNYNNNKFIYSQLDQKIQKIKYYDHVTNRHFSIIQKLMNRPGERILRYFYIEKDKERLNALMQNCLIFPFSHKNQHQQQNLGDQGSNFFFNTLSIQCQRKFIQQIAENLVALHQIELQHCDIRILNIVLSVLDNRFKLIDFDMSRIRQVKLGQAANSKNTQIQTKNAKHFVLEKIFQPYEVEIIENESKSKECKLFFKQKCGRIDSYMYGQILLRLLFKINRQQQQQVRQQVQKIIESRDLNNKYNKFSQDHKSYLGLIFKLVTPDFEERILCKQFLQEFKKIQILNKHENFPENIDYQEFTYVFKQNEHKYKPFLRCTLSREKLKISLQVKKDQTQNHVYKEEVSSADLKLKIPILYQSIQLFYLDLLTRSKANKLNLIQEGQTMRLCLCVKVEFQGQTQYKFNLKKENS